MQKIYDDVGFLDKNCCENFFLSEDILMENAALGIKKEIEKRFQKGSSILIVAGAGNNGADGIALARMLFGDYNVFLYLPVGAKSQMAKLQLSRAKSIGLEPTPKLIYQKYDIIVEAIFGSGINKSLSDEIDNLIETMNKLESFKIACDIPCGLMNEGRKNIFKADLTVSMGALKKILFYDFAKDFTGNIIVSDLGISRKIYESYESVEFETIKSHANQSNICDTFLVSESDLKLPLRHIKNTNKGGFGHLFVVGGEKKGAAILCAKGAFAFGAGLVTIFNTQDIVVSEEIMITKNSVLPKNTTAIVCGMGLGESLSYEDLKKILLNNYTLPASTRLKNCPLILDADIFYNKIFIDILDNQQNIIITPHPKEFLYILSLLMNIEINIDQLQNNRFYYAKIFTQRFTNIVLVLKGANTIIAQNGISYVCDIGSQVLAKGGSGDVLAGFIGSLVSQGYDLLQAAINGVLAHALAAKKFEESKNNYALTPQDLIEKVKIL